MCWEINLLKSQHWELWNLWMQAHRVLTQDVERRLQAEFGISKAEFSVLATLSMSPAAAMKVQDLVQSLGWEKSRVAHQLSRMESRGFVARAEGTKGGRRTAIVLTPEGHRMAKVTILAHGENIRQVFFDTLSPQQAEVIREWSTQVIAAKSSCFRL